MNEPAAAPRTDAATRVLRTITIVFAAATLVFLGLTVGSIVSESPYVRPLWHAVAVALVFGTPPVLGLLCLRLGLRPMRRLLGGYAIAYAVVMATWVPEMVSTMPLAMSPWPLSITALGTVPAALAWRPPIAWTYTGIIAVMMIPVRIFAAGTPDALTVALQDSLFSLTFSSIFTALAIVAMNNGYALDAAAASITSNAAGAAARVAGQREQARLDALVHDEVMTTLYYASLGSAELDESVRAQARRAINELSKLRQADESEPRPVGTAGFIASVRDIVAELAPDARFEVRGTRTLDIPADVAAALSMAIVEALRNSVTHAIHPTGPVSRSVRVDLNDSAVGVEVEDDGPGFEPGRVAQRRLGIALSIRGRLAAVPGGSASVESAVGQGVRVKLEWKQS